MTETFFYFTDSHLVNTAREPEFVDWAERYLLGLPTAFRASGAPFAVSGGDWFNSSSSKEGAMQMHARIRGMAEGMFGRVYFVPGNHDRNYQLKNEEGKIVRSPYELSPDELSAALLPNFKKSYYTFSGDRSRFYVFDSGIDWEHAELTPYDSEQILWFLDSLADSDDAHIILLPHMIYIRKECEHPATAAYAAIAAAYNARGCYTYADKAYDFSPKTGRIELILGGHVHRDREGLFHGIPFMTVRAMPTENGPSADCITLDYGTRVLRTRRFGDGNDRTLPLLP